MTSEEIIKIGLWVIASLGGAGGIILGFSNFFGGLFAKRYEEKVKAKFQKEIDMYQSQLDVIKERTLRYSSTQFDFYSKLWSSLYDLKVLGDDLWQEASPIRLEKFSKQLKTTRAEIEKSSLFIEDEHYRELMEILLHFSEYQIGKKSLIEYRKENGFDDYSTEQMIRQNGGEKQRYENLIKRIRIDLKRQLKGKDT